LFLKQRQKLQLSAKLLALATLAKDALDWSPQAMQLPLGSIDTR
jgi:hypothetical protein